MILKNADDKNIDIEKLHTLLEHPQLDASTKKAIEHEIRNIRAGIRAEQEVAYTCEAHFGDSTKWMVIHDLRIEHAGIVAQIDHVLINRYLDIWVCESKSFAEGIAINDLGECTAFYGKKPVGVPSPIEQNKRHIAIFQRWLKDSNIDLPSRLGIRIKPELHSLVLISNNARISRPKKGNPQWASIIKNEQLLPTLGAYMDNVGPLTVAKVVSFETLHRVATQIAQQHTPKTWDWAGKFGLSTVLSKSTLTKFSTTELTTEKGNTEKPSGKKCDACGADLPMNVARFCWLNKPKFQNKLYCLNCQKDHLVLYRK